MKFFIIILLIFSLFSCSKTIGIDYAMDARNSLRISNMNWAKEELISYYKLNNQMFPETLEELNKLEYHSKYYFEWEWKNWRKEVWWCSLYFNYKIIKNKQWEIKDFELSTCLEWEKEKRVIRPFN